MSSPTFKLDQLVDFQSKSKKKVSESSEKGKYPFYSSSVDQDKFINEADFTGPAIIFGTGGSANIHYEEGAFSTSADCFVVKNKNANELSLKFVYRYIYGNIHLVEEGFRGAGLKHVRKSYLQGISIPLLPLKMQQQIVDILDEADDLRKKREKSIEKLSELRKAIFYEMFGDPNLNPKSWGKKTLGNVVFDFKDGPHVSPKYTDSDGIPFLSTRNIRPGELLLDDVKFITKEEAIRQWKKIKPEKGDILYTKGGTTGYAKAVDTDIEFAVWVHLAVLKVNKDLVNSTWLEEMLNTKYCYEQSQRLTKGIANRDLGLKRMPNIRIYLPPIKLQNRYVEIIRHLNDIKIKADEAKLKTGQLFDSCLQKAFKGELNV